MFNININRLDNSINGFNNVNVNSGRHQGYDPVKPVMAVNGFVIFNNPCKS